MDGDDLTRAYLWGRRSAMMALEELVLEGLPADQLNKRLNELIDAIFEETDGKTAPPEAT